MRHARALARLTVLVAGLVAALVLPAGAVSAAPRVHTIASLPSGSGSTIGPRGDLFVASPTTGEIYRIDHRTHRVSTFHSGLPLQVAPVGGVMDVAFLHGKAYALVTLVGPDVGGSSVVGIYRLDSQTTATPVADIGTWSIAHPPPTDFFIPSGVQYSFEPFRGGFLVADGHHNRVLRVRLDGSISEFAVLDNVVPTGLEVRGHSVYLAEAGPVPHQPADGRVIRLDSRTGTVRGVVASGAPLLVDVEYGPGGRLYALSQGDFPGGDPGSPASPDTGSLVRATKHGSFATVATGLDRPTSLEVQGRTAYVVGLDGTVVSVPLGC